MVLLTSDWGAFTGYAEGIRVGTYQTIETETGFEVRIRAGRLGYIKQFGAEVTEEPEEGSEWQGRAVLEQDSEMARDKRLHRNLQEHTRGALPCLVLWSRKLLKTSTKLSIETEQSMS